MSKWNELKRLAEAANSASDGSPWAYEAHGDTGEYGVGILEDGQGNCVAGKQQAGEMLVLEPVAPEVNGQIFAAYIADAYPAAILELIAELEVVRDKASELSVEAVRYRYLATKTWSDDVTDALCFRDKANIDRAIDAAVLEEIL